MTEPDRERREQLARALAPVARQTRRLGLDWLLIGAAGRDLLLAENRCAAAARATHDVDIAVCVPSWEEFLKLKAALVDNEGARADAHAPQRLHQGDRLPLDLIPFGDIAADGKLCWPPDGDLTLNVGGLLEAHACFRTIALTEDLSVRIPSLEMFLCLKLFAWRDRHTHKPHHDSADLREFLLSADELIPLDELYDRYAPAMERNDFDAGRACFEVLGDRLRNALRANTAAEVARILAEQLDEGGAPKLLLELGDGCDALARLRAFQRGLGGATD